MISHKNIPKTSGIYKITNTINNKCYIGQAINLKNRIKGHMRCFLKENNNYPVYKSIRKHGIENFEVEILVQGNFSKSELNDLEIDFIRLYNSNNLTFGYNLTAGGGGVIGYKHTEQHKEKMRYFFLGKKMSIE